MYMHYNIFIYNNYICRLGEIRNYSARPGIIGTFLEVTAPLMSDPSLAGHNLLHQRLAPRQSGLTYVFSFFQTGSIPDVFSSSWIMNIESLYSYFIITFYFMNIFISIRDALFVARRWIWSTAPPCFFIVKPAQANRGNLSQEAFNQKLTHLQIQSPVRRKFTLW